MEETRWHLGAAQRCQIKLVFLSEYAVYQPHLTELEASQAHLLWEATNRLVATPAIHHVSLTARHRSLNHTFLAWIAVRENEVGTSKNLTHQAKLDAVDFGTEEPRSASFSMKSAMSILVALR